MLGCWPEAPFRPTGGAGPGYRSFSGRNPSLTALDARLLAGGPFPPDRRSRTGLPVFSAPQGNRRMGCLYCLSSQERLSPVALTDRDRAIIEFERTWWSEESSKEVLIRENFDLSTTRYYEILGELIDSREAYEFDPLVIRRLRRLRDRRRRARFERQIEQPPAR